MFKETNRNMQEERIAFETARLAKEKGFDIYNDFFYCENYGLCQLGEETLGVFNHPETKKYEVIYDCNHEFEEGERFYAHTQALLQKWLRETHNIYVDSYHDLTAGGKNIQYYTSWGFLQQKDANGNQNVNGWYDEYMDWKTYEEALEFGLREGLKLIEIVKEKK